LREYGKIYVKDGSEVSFENGVFPLELTVVPKKEEFITFTQIQGKEEFEFITSNYVLLENKIFQIRDIGEHFNNLKSFDTVIKKEKLEEFLTE